MTSRQSARPQLDPQLSPRAAGADTSGPVAPAPISAPIPSDERGVLARPQGLGPDHAPSDPAPAAGEVQFAAAPALGSQPAADPTPPAPPAPAEEADFGAEDEPEFDAEYGPEHGSEDSRIAVARAAYAQARLLTRRLRRDRADEASLAAASTHRAAMQRALNAAIAEVAAEAGGTVAPSGAASGSDAAALSAGAASKAAKAAAKPSDADSDEASLARPPLATAYEMLGMQASTQPTAKDAFMAMNTVVTAAKSSSKAETLALARAAREIALERIKAEKLERLKQQDVLASATAARGASPDAAATTAPISSPRIEAAASPLTGPLFRPPVQGARFMPRHLAMTVIFGLVVLLPALLMAVYLWTRAADQYASYLGFSVHQENSAGAASLLTGLSAISGSSSPDTDILYQYLQSQDLVSTINSQIDLGAIWSKPQRDPVFTYHGGTIEDLTDYWGRMVTVTYNQNARLIEVRVKAFEPQDAKTVAEAILAESTLMINRLNAVAAADAVRYAEEELAKTRETLVRARQALTAFRNTHQFVSPESETTAQSGIIAGLEEQLVTAYIELDTLRHNDNTSDPRVGVVERRIKVIEDRVAAERQKVGAGQGNGETAFVALVSDYERLAADVLFGETAYNAARSSLDAAQIDARRQNRYLAAHIRPTLAEAPRFPERLLLLSVASLFLLMAWAVGALFYYSLRDRH